MNIELKKIGEDYWEFLMRHQPTWATFLGDHRYDGELDQRGEASRSDALSHHQSLLTRLKNVPTDDLNQQDKISYLILEHKLNEFIESLNHFDWEWNLDQLFGPHLHWLDILNYHPLKTKKDFETLLSRYHQIPLVMEQYLSDLKDGLKSGRVAPAIICRRILKQLKGFLNQKPLKSRFADPLKKFPKNISVAEQRRLRDILERSIEKNIFPAYQKFYDFLRNDYRSKARGTVGIFAIPNGKESYAFRVKHETTTDFTPEELHQTGLDELKRNREEMKEIALKEGHHGDLENFLKKMKRDKSNYFKSEKEIIQKHQTTLEKMKKLLPKYFGVCPKIPFEVKAMEAFRAPHAPGAYYYPPSEDGKRGGIFWTNTYKPAQWAVYSMETLAYHEAIPGHHLQIALATEQKGLPKFRRHAGFTAYIEGWAHYAERLADEMGAYSNELQRVGMLMDQAWRAIRLVVDTGIHYFGWSREKAYQFMKETRTANEMEMNNEIDRYIVWPGQALAYKVGQRTFSELREFSKKELGSKFDIRKFHDTSLLSGALPLRTLRYVIQEWIKNEKSRHSI